MAAAAIEKKMDMSLDDIIKLNKSRATSSSAKGSAPKAGQAGGSKSAPKLLPKVSKPGVAGKRQAIQQKRSAPVTLAGASRAKPTAGCARVGLRTAPVSLAKTAKGGVAKPGAAAGGKRLKQTMAQKILTRARNAKQQSTPRGQGVALTKRKGAATQAPKQLVGSGSRPAKQPAQFSLPGGRRPPQGSPAKSVAQQMKRPRGGRPVQAPKQLAGGAGTRQVQGNNSRAPLVQPQRGGRGLVAPQQQLNRVARGAVQKQRGQQQQQRAPVFMGHARMQGLPPPQQQRQQQQFPRGGGGRGQAAGRRPAVVQQQQPRQQGGRGSRTQQQQHASYNAPVMVPPQHHYSQHRGSNSNQAILPAQQQQVALAALRMQQLEEARQRAERAAFIHATMQVLTPHLGRR